MQAAAVKAPKDFEVLGAYGKALADNGEYLQAKDVLTRAYPAERPDWTILRFRARSTTASTTT